MVPLLLCACSLPQKRGSTSLSAAMDTTMTLLCIVIFWWLPHCMVSHSKISNTWHHISRNSTLQACTHAFSTSMCKYAYSKQLVCASKLVKSHICDCGCVWTLRIKLRMTVPQIIFSFWMKGTVQFFFFVVTWRCFQYQDHIVLYGRVSDERIWNGAVMP